MTNLTIGQRIDVYEVVDDIPNVFGQNCHGIPLGTHFAIKVVSPLYKFPIIPISEKLAPFGLLEARKCGYYLKVKSLK